jgi:hypothetical protein
MEHQPRKVIASKQSQPKRGAMWAAKGKVIGVKLLNSIGSHIKTPPVSAITYGATGFNVFPVWFLVFPFYSSTPQFWIGNVYSVPLYLGNM